MNDIYTLNLDNKYEGLPSLFPIQDKKYFKYFVKAKINFK